MTFEEKTTITFDKHDMDYIDKSMRKWEEYSCNQTSEKREEWIESIKDMAFMIYENRKEMPF